MDEPFRIPVTYKEKEYQIDARLQPYGFTHRFIVMIEGVELFLERDEEGSYRALVPPHTQEKDASRLDKGLVQAVITKLEKILS